MNYFSQIIWFQGVKQSDRFSAGIVAGCWRELGKLLSVTLFSSTLFLSSPMHRHLKMSELSQQGIHIPSVHTQGGEAKLGFRIYVQTGFATWGQAIHGSSSLSLMVALDSLQAFILSVRLLCQMKHLPQNHCKVQQREIGQTLEGRGFVTIRKSVSTLFSADNSVVSTKFLMHIPFYSWIHFEILPWRILTQHAKIWDSQVVKWQRIHLPVQQMWEMQVDPWVGKIPWRRKWQLTPVFLPGKFHGQGSLADYSPWGHKESDTTERLSTHVHVQRYITNMILISSKEERKTTVQQ